MAVVFLAVAFLFPDVADFGFLERPDAGAAFSSGGSFSYIETYLSASAAQSTRPGLLTRAAISIPDLFSSASSLLRRKLMLSASLPLNCLSGTPFLLYMSRMSYKSSISSSSMQATLSVSQFHTMFSTSS